MIVVLLIINHFSACMWFYFGTHVPLQEGELTWLDASGFDGVWGFAQYLVAFHWSLTQFTPASMSVQPANEVERAYAIVVVVFALVGFSYLVGSITGSLARLRALGEEGAKEFWKLRRFLKRNSVSTELSLRIQRYLEYK